MNIKETKEVCKTITLNTICKAYVQQNYLIWYVGKAQGDSEGCLITKEHFPFIYTHLN